MTDRLEPCPFCGGEGRYWHDWSSVAAQCSNIHRFPDPCPMRLQGPTKQSKEEAAAAWNTRAISAALASEREREVDLKKCIEGFIRANNDAPEFGMCDCIDNDGEHYQSADLAALLIHARTLLWGGEHLHAPGGMDGE